MTTAGGSVPTGPWTTLLTGVLKCRLAFGNVKKSFSSTTGQFKKKKKKKSHIKIKVEFGLH